MTQQNKIKGGDRVRVAQSSKGGRALVVLALTTLLAAALVFSGCASPGGGSGGSSGVAENDAAEQTGILDRQIVIGSMITEDILPMWVAEAEDIFAEFGIDARVETFQSAQELSTAIVSGSVDMAMTDIMVSASLTASGTPVTMEWVTLGTTASQGRFGIMASPESGITSLKELAGVPIGVGSNTIVEYVMDMLLRDAGLSEDEIVSEEIKKVPVRYEMMTSNQVAAAALPGSLLALGEATGMVLVGDDSTGNNYSQSVMIVRNDLAGTSLGIAMVETLAQVWDEAVKRINANPESYRSLLVEMAQLPEPVQESYTISEYPETARPTAAMVTPVLDWMFEKGYLDRELTYDFATGSFKE